MSNTGPFGHQPTSLSLGMGLSDPRLRRALQLDGVSEQKIGFGLKIDSEGRLSVDSAGLAGDQTTITNIVQSFANFSSSTNTTISGGGGGGGFDDSLFDDWLSNTLLYAEVQKLIEATGVNDPQFGWFSGGSPLFGSSNILSALPVGKVKTHTGEFSGIQCYGETNESDGSTTARPQNVVTHELPQYDNAILGFAYRIEITSYTTELYNSSGSGDGEAASIESLPVKFYIDPTTEVSDASNHPHLQGVTRFATDHIDYVGAAITSGADLGDDAWKRPTPYSLLGVRRGGNQDSNGGTSFNKPRVVETYSIPKRNIPGWLLMANILHVALPVYMRRGVEADEGDYITISGNYELKILYS